MAYGEITVGELRKIIADLPDVCHVVVKPHSPDDFASCEEHSRREGAVVQRIPARHARPWNYCTRFVQNVYTANDDRFSNSRILLLEIGEDTP